jgi:MtN3 and saliva related transmembrane protein
MNAADLTGYAAAVCSTVSFAPQAWKILRTQDASAISVRMYAVTVIGFGLWTAYGVMLNQWPIIATNSICFLLAGFILVMKLVSRRTRRQLAEGVGVVEASQASE